MEEKPFLPQTSIVAKLSSFDEAKFFEPYHYYEKYDEENKYYTNEQFERNYGHGYRMYAFRRIRVTFYEDTLSTFPRYTHVKCYVVAEEKLSESERLELAKYCQCCLCQVRWWHLLTLYKLLTGQFDACPCCQGCMYSSIPIDQATINSAREAKHKAEMRF